MNGTSKRALALLLPLGLMTAAVNEAAAKELSTFAILAGSTVTNVGSSVINGNVGLSPGDSVTGFFPPGIVNVPYEISIGDEVAIQAQIDLVSAYNSYSSRPTTATLTGTDLGGLVLAPGVYAYATSAQLTGTLTLDGLGNSASRFIFKIGTTLTTASSSVVALINEAQGANVFFIVGSSATLGSNSVFVGNIMALSSITLNSGASINCGSALAQNGAVTLISNTISVCELSTVDLGTVLDDTPVTPNETAVADVLDDIAAGGELPDEFLDLIAFLTPDEIRAALAELAGQVGTAVAPAGQAATSTFLSQISNRLDDDRTSYMDDGKSPVDDRGPPDSPADQQGPATVRTLGYASGEQAQIGSGANSFAAMPIAPDQARWTVWGGAYGERSKTDGDSFDGTYDRTIEAFGFAAGMDTRITPDTKVGFAISAGGSDFDLADNFGSGSSDILQAALYGRQDIGAAYVSGIVAYAWNDVSTERFRTIGGFDRFTADFSAHNLAGQIEAGYRFALPDMMLPGSGGITPYAAVQVQSFHTPSYSETADSGPTVFALNYDASTSTSTRTELGAKFDRSMALNDTALLTLRSRVAWAHDEGDDSVTRASFQTLPDSGFTVRGAEGDADSVLLSGGAEIGFVNGFAASATIDSRFAKNAQAYGASARLSYSW